MRLTRKFSYQPSNGQTEKQTGCTNTFMDITMPLMSVDVYKRQALYHVPV